MCERTRTRKLYFTRIGSERERERERESGAGRKLELKKKNLNSFSCIIKVTSLTWPNDGA